MHNTLFPYYTSIELLERLHITLKTDGSNYMNAFQIKDIKGFMAALLTSETFDSFLLEEATITTYNTFIIDGRLVKEFFQSKDEDISFLNEYEFSKWKDMRSLCFQLIKGKKTPVSFKFILHLSPSYAEKLLDTGDTNITTEQLKAFLLNIKYDSGHLSLVTAISFHTFLLDKSADILWDSAIKEFLTKHGIEFDEES